MPTRVQAAKDKVIKIDPDKHHCQGSEAARNLAIPVLWLMEFNFDVSFDTAGCGPAHRTARRTSMITEECPLSTAYSGHFPSVVHEALDPLQALSSLVKPLGVTVK
jgi:hypothetical protein